MQQSVAAQGQANEEVVCFLRQAAERGDAIAQVGLSFRLTEGRGAPTDRTEALMWLKRAADQGNAAGLLSLAGLYVQGDAQAGVRPDPARSIELYTAIAAL